MMPIKRRTPPRNDRPDYSRAFYPDPPSHDFLVWLVIAELMRRHHNAPAPLRVTFGLQSGQLGTVDYGPGNPWGGQVWRCDVSKEYSDLMIANVLRPAIEMIGAVEERAMHAPFYVDQMAHLVEYDYHIWQLTDAARAGHKIPQWTIPQWAHDEVRRFLGNRRPVIITLRETEAQPERNSQISEWLKFAEWIEGDHEVLFLRDTCRAGEPLSRFPIWPRASRNAYVRAALYQRAFVNMMVGTGPIGWCLFSEAPYLQFKQLIPALPEWDHGNAKGWREQAHLEIGEQYPWASPLQRLTWTDDTFVNIRDEFDRFVGMAQRRAA